jgi:hypothetical protein
LPFLYRVKGKRIYEKIESRMRNEESMSMAVKRKKELFVVKEFFVKGKKKQLKDRKFLREGFFSLIARSALFIILSVKLLCK